MSGRRRQSLSPTLFPFLAVLVCTLGTLILLLALVAQNTSEAAQQLADRPIEEPVGTPDQLTVGDVQLLVEEEEFRLGELVSFREAQTADLENRRNQLAHVEDHMRRIRERLEQIAAAMQQAASDDATPAASETELEMLKQQLLEEQAVVKKLREEIKTEKPRFVIVPHQGPNGTNRRPVYLECTSKGVTIWPEGVQITKWQLEHSSSDANPLDDALRAARYHAMQAYGDEIPPYPMLLVRPEGVDSYYAARAAMLDWDDQFGYELIPSEIQLAYPNADPIMRQRMEYAVAEAVQRVTQRSVARSISGAGSRNPGPPGGRRGLLSGTAERRGTGSGLATSRSGSPGQAGSQPPPSPKKMPRLSVAEMDLRGRQSGFRDHRSLPSRGYTTGSSGGSTISAEAAKRRLERQLADSTSSFDPSAAERAIDRAAETAVGQIGSGPTAQTASQSAASSAEPSASPASTLNAPADPADDRQLATGAPGDAGPGSPQTDNSEMANANPGGRPQASKTSNSGTESNPAASGPSARAMTSIDQQTSPDMSQRMKADASQGFAAESSPPRPDSTNPRPNRSAAMVQRSGVDWALPSSVAVGRGNEIVRSIRVRVHEDRFVILPGAGSRVSETFPVAPQGVDLATLQLATSVRDRIDRWGTAAPGARWSPRLLVDVMAGAEGRFNQLSRLMTGSGLSIERARDEQAETNAGGDFR